MPSWAQIRAATRSIRHPNSKIPFFRDNVHGVLKSQILGLFKAENFCYATYSAGRTPTLYFAQNRDLQNGSPCGRLRTTHPNGPLIDYTTTNKTHRFFPNVGARNVGYNLLANGVAPPAAFLAMNAVPIVGHCHVEFTNVGGMVRRRHRSGGLVRLGPVPTTAQIKKIIERMFISGCAIKVNGHVAGGFNLSPPRIIGPLPHWGASLDLGPYLASL
ncbi:hypothetical protein [Aliikangiella sp. IMCC44359]|uniref:hypothetical protein n=1 Tax=Aliikangiella sp. IMCC44359 TaxID=3459125 RepID=UPI00403AEE7E